MKAFQTGATFLCRKQSSTHLSLNKKRSPSTRTPDKSQFFKTKGKVIERKSNVPGPKMRVQEADCYEIDDKGRSRLKYEPEGWSFWEWKGFQIHYVAKGSRGPPILFVHGFGAHSYHWRYQIAALSRNCRVYCVDLLGYGWSQKALVDYSTDLWAEQVNDFVREVIGAKRYTKVVLAGNSIGCVICAAAAGKSPNLYQGIVFINSAVIETTEAVGNPNSCNSQQMEAHSDEAFEVMFQKIMKSAFSSHIPVPVINSIKRALTGLIFSLTKLRIIYILKQVYHDVDQVDMDLVRSIRMPAKDPLAFETFYRLSQGLQDAPYLMGKLMRDSNKSRSTRLLLLWGEKDTIFTRSHANSIRKLRPDAEYIGVSAGHCAHDDNPEEVNYVLRKWIKGIYNIW